MHDQIGLLGNLAISLVLATVLGIIATKLRLSAIVGYLLAGIILGPQTPGFVGNYEMAAEFAEVGVVLLMFGVGLHFKLKDLMAVKRIALPGAIAQFIVATTFSLFMAMALGLDLPSGLVLGASVSIASTVVVTRVLMDSDQLQTPVGFIAVGWLIAQDVVTVLLLVAMPALALSEAVDSSTSSSLVWTLGFALIRVILLCAVVIVFGNRAVPWILRLVASTRSRELFTLTILALALAIAVGSSMLFGVSMALGAFLAGMVVGQTDASHQAAADAMPMRDAFAVLFFVSVGMLFDPHVFVELPGVFVSLTLIVMVVNPVTAFLIAWLLRYSIRTCIALAFLLSQIGEFSFLLTAQAVEVGLLSPQLRSVLVAVSILSIALNPLIYRLSGRIERELSKKRKLWKLLNRRSNLAGAQLNIGATASLELQQNIDRPTAIIVGFGPVGQTVRRLLTDFGVQPVIIDLNLETVRELRSQGVAAIYGDAGNREILASAQVKSAKYLLITIPEMIARSLIILTARSMNPDLRVFVRTRYIRDQVWLNEVGATGVVTEEEETAVALGSLLLREMGASEERILEEAIRIHESLSPQLGNHP